MISKKIIGLGWAVIAVGIVLYFSSKRANPPAVELPLSNSIQEQVETSTVSAQRPPAGNLPSALTDTNLVAKTIATLQEIATRDDAESFQSIMTELTNASPEIRQAALDAAIQFGSREAIPVLEELAAKTEDAREKVEILDAIEFLELPPLSEVRRTPRTNSNPGRIQLTPK